MALQTAAALLFCGGLQARGQADSAAMERQFQAAMAAQDRGDLRQAETLLRDLHAKHPGIFAVDESLGLLYVGQEKFEEALALLEAAAKEEPKSDTAHVNLGADYYRLHRNAEALEEFQLAARLNPRKAETQQALGQLRLEMHHPLQAAEAFSAAIALAPENTELQLNKAQALLEADRLDDARKTLAAYPNAERSAAAQSLWGDLEEKAGNFQQAAQHYSHAVDLDPSEENAWNLAYELLRHWSFEPATADLEAAVVKFPESDRMRMGLGVAYFGKANFGKAVPIFAGLLRRNPENAVYAEMLGMSCTAVLDSVQADCDVLVDYAQKHPSNARVAVAAAAGLMQTTADDAQIALAYRLLRSAIAADPKLADARYRLGLLDQEQNHWRESIPSLEAAIALKPEHAQAH
ncbi:MAG TPA: tetratricopeptide repeat protein, partial [Acidobacteriaceae bacterium]